MEKNDVHTHVLITRNGKHLLFIIRGCFKIRCSKINEICGDIHNEATAHS